MKNQKQITYTTCVVTVNTKGKAMSLGKFRVSLSIEHINWILENCKEIYPDLYNQLLLHKIKAEGGVTQPAFIPKTPVGIPGLRKGATIKEKYDYVVSCINKNILYPAELQDSYDEYRYLNDLMNQQEMEAYEKIALGDM